MPNIGTTVWAFKYKDGVMVAADTQVTGGWLKLKDFHRILPVGEESVIACSGEMSDLQNLKKMLDVKYEEDVIENDGALFMHPRQYHNYIGQYQYKKRMKGDPVQVNAIVAGIDKSKNEVFLGCSDVFGMKLEKDYFITGLGMHYCGVIFAKNWKPDMTEAEARQLVETCGKVMFTYDKKALDKIQFTTITHANGVQIGEP